MSNHNEKESEPRDMEKDEALSDDVFEEPRGRPTSMSTVPPSPRDSATISKRSRIPIISSLSSPAPKNSRYESVLSRGAQEFDEMLNRIGNDETMEELEDGIFVSKEKTEKLLGELTGEQSRCYRLMNDSLAGARGIRESSEFLKLLTKRQQMEFEEIFVEPPPLTYKYGPIMGIIPNANVAQTADMRKMRWIEKMRREGEEMAKTRNDFVDMAAVGIEGAYRALNLPLPIQPEHVSRMAKYLANCREKTKTKYDAAPTSSSPTPPPAPPQSDESSSTRRLEGSMRTLSIDLPPTASASLKERVTTKKVDLLTQELREKNKCFHPHLQNPADDDEGSDDEEVPPHILLCPINDLEVTRIPEELHPTILWYDQGVWRDTDSSGNRNRHYERRKEELRKAIKVIDVEHTWKNPKQGAVKFILHALRSIHKRCKLGFSGLGSLRKLYVSDESFLAAFRDIFALAEDMEEFPEDVPQIRFEVQSVTMTHAQLSRFLASVLLKPDGNGFANLLESTNPVAVSKARAFLESSSQLAKLPGVYGCVSFRTVFRERDYEKKYADRAARMLPAVEVAESIDVSESGTATKVVWVENGLGKTIFQRTKVTEEDRVILEHPELLIASQLCPSLDKYVIFSVVGSIQYSRCSRSFNGQINLKKLAESPDVRIMNLELDECQRICHEHVFVEVPKFDTKEIGPQISFDPISLNPLLARICLSMLSQEHIDIPVIVGVPEDGNANEQVIFVFLLLASMFTQRQLLFNASGDSVWQEQCKKLVNRVKEQNVTYGQLLRAIEDLRQVDLGTDGLFRELMARL